MWKKLLAVVAVVMTITSTTASALIVVPGGNPAGVTVISNLTVSPSTFDASKGEKATVSFGLSQSSEVYAYVLSKSTNEVVTTLANHVQTLKGNVSYEFTGKSGNVALDDGAYTVKVFTSSNGVQTGADFKEVTIATVVVQNPLAPKVTALAADPSAFSAESDEDTDVSFEVDKDGYLGVVIKKGASTVKTFADYDGNDFYRTSEDHSVNWNGTDDNGNKVANGTYTVVVTATNDSGTNTLTTNVEVQAAAVSSSGVIKDLTLDPSGTWDPTQDDELVIEYELTSTVKSLVVEAKNGNKVVEITDDSFVDDDDYTDTWDGTDEDGDYVSPGTWTITVRADGSKVSSDVKVEYDEPTFDDAFVTKKSFDPSENEWTTLAFRLEAAANVKVEVYKGSKKELTLVNNEHVSKNRWYTVDFNGMDRDGEEVERGSDWKFRITAENETENDLEVVKTVEFDVAEDDVSDDKSNVTVDYMSPAAFDDERSEALVLGYSIDEDAEVYAAIYEGTSTGGKAEIELMDYEEQSAGSHTVQWDGRDEDGKKLKDGTYTYKIISRANGSHKDTEVGEFVIGNSGDFGGIIVEPPTPESDCDAYWDLSKINNSELCDAITWVTNEGIFGGYTDGSFQPYQSINRAEMLKVVLRAFGNAVSLLPADGTTQGFGDVDANGWYMPYVRTAKFYGMLYGYSNGTEARLSNKITRVEALKFALEASEAFTNYTIKPYSYIYYADVNPADSNQKWFLNYVSEAYAYILLNERYDNESGKYFIDPYQEIQRGEVALLLYRMNKHNLLGNTGWTQTGGDYGYTMGY